MTGADELIKLILQKIHQKYQIGIDPIKNQEKSNFILQVKGQKEYIYGGHSLYQFQKVRLLLRGLDHLNLYLTEMPQINNLQQLFPPIIERSLNDLQKGQISQINWNMYKNIPMIIWHPSVDLPPEIQLQNPSQRIIFYNQLPQNLGNQSFFNYQKDKNQIFNTNEYNINKDNDIYQKIEFSGNCDQIFKIKIHGLENIQKIFQSTLNQNSQINYGLFNGKIPPQYITLEREKQKLKKFQKIEKVQENKQQKQNKAGNQTLKFVKNPNNTTEQQIFQSGNDNISNIKNQYDHGQQGSQNYNDLYKSMGLDCYPYVIYVEAFLLFGSKLLNKQCKTQTKKINFCYKPRFQQWLNFDDLKLSQIPKETKLCFNIYIQYNETKQIIGSTSTMIFNNNGKLNQGNISLNLWPFYEVDTKLTCMQQYWYVDSQTKININDKIQNKKYDINKELQKAFAQIHIQIQQFEFPVFHSVRNQKQMEMLGYPKLQTNIQQFQNWNDIPQIKYLAKLQQLLSTDSIQRESFTEKDKFILKICRNHYKSLPQTLQIYLGAVDWSDPTQIEEVYQLLYEWQPLSPTQALPLINVDFADQNVRLYAVDKINSFGDEELEIYMLQIVQALFFEPYHLSALAEMILERSLKNIQQVGNSFFWQIKSQLHKKASYERFILLLEQFIMLSGNFRSQIVQQVILNEKLNTLSQKLKQNFKNNNDMVQQKQKAQQLLQILQTQLNQQYSSFNFAIDNKMQCQEIDIQQCKVLKSKKKPLWLVMKNYFQEEQIQFMFKRGDDIRQDQLVLQLIKIIDNIWLNDGFDFRMNPYKAIATDDQVGMIEVVKNSETICDIHNKYGGILGPLKQKTIWYYLKENNPDPHQFEIATENFLKSCAGYCVATYILGIGDRHSGNIMITKSGHLFHIDFGHFLGNFKTKLGIKRERAPFVFTKEMAYVFGGTDGKLFLKYQEYCTIAFNLVRKHGQFLIDICQMMVCAGIPELQSSKDILYLQSQLSLNLNDNQAKIKFKNAIIESLNSKFRKVDDIFHLIKLLQN